jgi:hypothetical protein
MDGASISMSRLKRSHQKAEMSLLCLHAVVIVCIIWAYWRRKVALFMHVRWCLQVLRKSGGWCLNFVSADVRCVWMVLVRFVCLKWLCCSSSVSKNWWGAVGQFVKQQEKKPIYAHTEWFVNWNVGLCDSVLRSLSNLILTRSSFCVLWWGMRMS